jgi:acetyl esterase/lipase
MPSLSSRLVTALLIMTCYRHRLDSASNVERYVREHSVRPAPFAPPRRLDRKVAFSVDTRQCWTCYRVVPRSAPTPTGQVLYVHGGGFISEILPMHWSLIAKITNKGPAEVTVPIYPLAPHSTASQTVPVATDIAADLIARSGAENVTLMGDSAGGNIVLGIAQALRHRGLPQPRQLVLISPGLDASKSNPAIASVARYDRVLSVAGSRASTQLYIGELDSKDPLVSPALRRPQGACPHGALQRYPRHPQPRCPCLRGPRERRGGGCRLPRGTRCPARLRVAADRRGRLGAHPHHRTGRQCCGR